MNTLTLLAFALFSATLIGPALADGVINNKGEDGGGDSSYQDAPRINRFSEPPSRIEEYIVTGAILGSFAFAAYLVGGGKVP